MTHSPVPLWETPEIQSINRLPMGSCLVPFPSAQAALADALAGPEHRDPKTNPYFHSLDGEWSFRLLHSPLGMPGSPSEEEPFPQWVKPGFDVSSWPHIQVPGTWTLQGFDKPHYTNVQMPFDTLPPFVPEHNPTGLYRTGFHLPSGWKDRRVALHIGSAESCCMVYVNGFFVGAGKDTRLPQEYDISPYVYPEKENIVCIKVIRYSDASYIEDQDQWWFGGIHRSVFLYSTEDCYIKDIKALPGPAPREAGGRASLGMELTLGGGLPAETDGEGFTVSYALYPFVRPESLAAAEKAARDLIEGKKPLVSGEVDFKPDYRVNSNGVAVELELVNPAVWSHESPNLYVLVVSVSGQNRHIGSAAFCTGFRSVRVAERELLINERPLLIKGVNRHEHDEKKGKTLSTASMVRDIMLLKRHNFNAVRTCHYPDDERWYELCDRYGIYLIDEANIEHHCFYDQLCRDTAWSGAYISRVERMAERDKNHPSVIIWSLGNESGDGGNNALCGAWLRRYDAGRPVHYEGAVRPEKGQGAYTIDSLSRGIGVTDIIAPMYPPIRLITDFAKYRNDSRPLIMCEYSHAMGNSNGSLADYWEAIESHHGLQGGFIWDWIDQGIEAFTPDGKKYWKYGGDFGDRPTDYDFCLNGLLFPDQTPKPAMSECKQVFCPVKIHPVPGKSAAFIIENHFDFSSLDSLELRWRLCSERGDLAAGTEAPPALAPGGSAEISLPAGDAVGLAGANENGILYFHIDICLKNDTFWAKAGFVIGSAERIIRERLPLALPNFAVSVSTPPAAAPAPPSDASVRALKDFALGFRPCLFRVPTENDGLKTYARLRGESSAVFYYRGKAMYPWLDFDLLHLRCAGEKTESSSLDGRPARCYTATLLSGKAAAPGFENRALGSFTSFFSDETYPFIMECFFDLNAEPSRTVLSDGEGAGGRASPPDLPELPRVGIMAKIPSFYDSIEWFGAGPHENYPDRKAGAFLGSYKDTPSSLEVPYVVPQENGSRGGVRSIRLSGQAVPQGQPASIAIQPSEPVHMGVYRYDSENMLEALHTWNLEDRSAGRDGYYWLHIDCAQRGLGTATCGPDTLEQYRVRPGQFSMKLYLF
jgi:beta-galactosidase